MKGKSIPPSLKPFNGAFIRLLHYLKPVGFLLGYMMYRYYWTGFFARLTENLLAKKK